MWNSNFGSQPRNSPRFRRTPQNRGFPRGNFSNSPQPSPTRFSSNSSQPLPIRFSSNSPQPSPTRFSSNSSQPSPTRFSSDVWLHPPRLQSPQLRNPSAPLFPICQNFQRRNSPLNSDSRFSVQKDTFNSVQHLKSSKSFDNNASHTSKSTLVKNTEIFPERSKYDAIPFLSESDDCSVPKSLYSNERIPVFNTKNEGFSTNNDYDNFEVKKKLCDDVPKQSVDKVPNSKSWKKDFCNVEKVEPKRYEKEEQKSNISSASPKIESEENSTPKSDLMHAVGMLNELVVGLDYVTEYKQSSNSKNFPFRCNLCNAAMLRSNVLEHVVGIKHRMRYMKLKDPKEYERISGLKIKNDEKIIEVEKVTTILKKTYGQGIVKVELGSKDEAEDNSKQDFSEDHTKNHTDEMKLNIDDIPIVPVVMDSTDSPEKPPEPGVLSFLGDAKMLTDILSAAKAFSSLPNTPTSIDNESKKVISPNVGTDSVPSNQSQKSDGIAKYEENRFFQPSTALPAFMTWPKDSFNDSHRNTETSVPSTGPSPCSSPFLPSPDDNITRTKSIESDHYNRNQKPCFKTYEHSDTDTRNVDMHHDQQGYSQSQYRAQTDPFGLTVSNSDNQYKHSYSTMASDMSHHDTKQSHSTTASDVSHRDTKHSYSTTASDVSHRDAKHSYSTTATDVPHRDTKHSYSTAASDVSHRDAKHSYSTAASDVSHRDTKHSYSTAASDVSHRDTKHSYSTAASDVSHHDAKHSFSTTASDVSHRDTKHSYSTTASDVSHHDTKDSYSTASRQYNKQHYSTTVSNVSPHDTKHSYCSTVSDVSHGDTKMEHSRREQGNLSASSKSEVSVPFVKTEKDDPFLPSEKQQYSEFRTSSPSIFSQEDYQTNRRTYYPENKMKRSSSPDSFSPQTSERSMKMQKHDTENVSYPSRQVYTRSGSFSQRQHLSDASSEIGSPSLDNSSRKSWNSPFSQGSDSPLPKSVSPDFHKSVEKEMADNKMPLSDLQCDHQTYSSPTMSSTFASTTEQKTPRVDLPSNFKRDNIKKIVGIKVTPQELHSPTPMSESKALVDKHNKNEDNHMTDSKPLLSVCSSEVDVPCKSDITSTFLANLSQFAVTNEGEANMVVQVVSNLIETFLQFKLRLVPDADRESLIKSVLRGQQTGTKVVLNILDTKVLPEAYDLGTPPSAVSETDQDSLKCANDVDYRQSVGTVSKSPSGEDLSLSKKYFDYDSGNENQEDSYRQSTSTVSDNVTPKENISGAVQGNNSGESTLDQHGSKAHQIVSENSAQFNAITDQNPVGNDVNFVSESTPTVVTSSAAVVYSTSSSPAVFTQSISNASGGTVSSAAPIQHVSLPQVQQSHMPMYPSWPGQASYGTEYMQSFMHYNYWAHQGQSNYLQQSQDINTNVWIPSVPPPPQFAATQQSFMPQSPVPQQPPPPPPEMRVIQPPLPPPRLSTSQPPLPPQPPQFSMSQVPLPPPQSSLSLAQVPLPTTTLTMSQAYLPTASQFNMAQPPLPPPPPPTFPIDHPPLPP